MEVTIELTDKTSVKVTPEQGTRIRNAILEQIDCSFRYYVENRVGLYASNVSSMLSGQRPVTIGMLRRLLSGTRIEIEACTLSFTLENTTGGIVPIVDSPTLEEMLCYHEDVPSEKEKPSQDLSSSLEKPQVKLKTLLGTRSWETPEGS